MPKKKKTNTEFKYLIQYLQQVLDWRLWVKNADDLLAASKKLEPSIKRFYVVSTENMIKERENVKEGKCIAPWKKTGPHLQAIYSMLVAYALENLCKASLILKNKKQYEEEIFQEGGLPKDLQTLGHNLLKLVRKLNLDIDVDEANLLLRLSRNSRWQGRYPVPLKAVDLNSVIKDDNGKVHKEHFVAFLAPDDIPKVKLFIERIKKNIKYYSS